MKYYSNLLLFTALFLGLSNTVFAQNVGISGTAITPDPQSILELRSSTKGVLLPRMTTAEAATLAGSLNAADDGMTVYDTDLKLYKYWNGTTLSWNTIATSASVTGASLDDVYDAGGSGTGRTITADAGAVQITGTGGATGLITDGDIQLTLDDAWIGAGATLERIEFDQSLSRIDLEAADVTMDNQKWIGVDGSSPRIVFDDTAGRLNMQDANIEIDNNKWLGLGSTIERIVFQGTDNEINIMGAEVGIGTLAPSTELDVNGQIRMRTGSTLGYIPVGDANGVMTWTDPNALGIDGNTLDEAYDQGGAGAGRIITADNGAVEVAGVDGFLVTGTYLSGATVSVTGLGTRMFFNPRKAAFRVGRTTSSSWDNANIGNSSVAMGVSTTASGLNSISIGTNNTASGDYSTALGLGTVASGNYSFSGGSTSTASGLNSTAFGSQTTASGNNSFALGNTSVSSGRYSTAMGSSTTAKSGYEMVVGRYNTNYTPTSTTAWNVADRLFVVGNGTSGALLSNALTILKNGNTGIGTDSPSDNLHVYEDVNAGIGVTIENPNTGNAATSALVFGYAGSEYAGIYSRSATYPSVPDYLQIINNHGTGSTIEMVNNGAAVMTIDDAGSVKLNSYNSATSGLIYADNTGTLLKNDYSGNATDVLTGTGTWASASSLVSGNTLDGAYDQGGAGVGRVITTDNGAVDLQGAGGLHVTGNVGIGTTSPNASLEVNSNNADFIIKSIRNNSTNGVLSGIGLGAQGSSHVVKSGLIHERTGGNGLGKLHLVVDDSNDANDVSLTESRMTILTDGKIGIGTTTPGQLLDVNGDVRFRNGTLDIWSFNGNEGGQINLSDGGSNTDGQGNAWSLDVFNNDFRLMDDGVVRVFVQDNGNLGIGTTSPAEKLHVVGNARITGLSAGGNVQADGSGNLIISSDIPGGDSDYIQNQNAADQAANFRINGWGEAFGYKINSSDGEKLQFTSLGANGSKIRHTSGWSLDYHAGPGNTGVTGSHRFYTTAQNIYRERLGIESTGRVNIRQDIGGDPAFTGLESAETANGRAQLVLSSSYSDMVIASRETNNLHGSTLTFATYNPANANDYRKFVVNQGNWGNRRGFLDFGYSDAGGRTNPHSNINATDNVISLDGFNKRVGIQVENPEARLHVRASGNNNPNNNGIYIYNPDTGGDNDDAILTLRTNNSSAGDPFIAWDINGVTGFSMGMDNSDGDKLKIGNSWSDPATNTRMTIETGGNVGIGTTAPSRKLHVSGNIYASTTLEAAANGTWYLRGGDDHELRDVNVANTMGVWGRQNSDRAGIQLGSDGSYIFGDNGNIGVGTISPSEKLHVSGNARVSGLAGTGNRDVYADANGVLKAGKAIGNVHSFSSNMRHSPDDVNGTTLSGDDVAINYNLPFTINIGGTNYTQIRVCSNGWVTFGTNTSTSLGNNCLPTSTFTQPLIAAYWDDLVTEDQNIEIEQGGTAPGRVVTIKAECYKYNNSGDDINYEIMIHEKGMITVSYWGVIAPTVIGQSATIGFQMAGGGTADAYPISCDEEVIDDNDERQGWSIYIPQ